MFCVVVTKRDYLCSGNTKGLCEYWLYKGMFFCSGSTKEYLCRGNAKGFILVKKGMIFVVLSQRGVLCIGKI